MKLPLVPTTKLREESDLNWLDQEALRRFEADNLPSKFASKRAPSYYPGYKPEEVDDGRLDPILETGFIPKDEIPDAILEIDSDELIEEMDDVVDLTSPTFTPPVPAAPKGPRSNRNYRKESRQQYQKVQFVGVLQRGRGIIPYTTGMLSR